MFLLFMTEPNQIFRLSPVLFLQSYISKPEALKRRDKIPRANKPSIRHHGEIDTLTPDEAMHRFENSVCPNVKSL